MTSKKMASDRIPTGADKGEARRQQVLDAATKCFRHEGIHGTSIARICQVAGMSPGHIYHYFENKEAIVEAIAERERNDLAGLLENLEAYKVGTPLVERLVGQSHQMQQKIMDADHVGLMLELAAEGSRNPAVRTILQHSDEEIRARFMETLENMGFSAEMDEIDLEQRMELIISLKMGLAMRTIQNARLDVPALQDLVDSVLRFLLSAPRKK
jgi:AcrR family transcriptional regulator